MDTAVVRKVFNLSHGEQVKFLKNYSKKFNIVIEFNNNNNAFLILHLTLTAIYAKLGQ